MSEVKLPLSTITDALFPPDTVGTVEDYQEYLKELFGSGRREKSTAGRPIKRQHPMLSQEELITLYERVKHEVEKDEDAWKNKRGRPPRCLHPDQPNDACLIRLDNDVYANFISEGMPPIPFEEE